MSRQRLHDRELRRAVPRQSAPQPHIPASGSPSCTRAFTLNGRHAVVVVDVLGSQVRWSLVVGDDCIAGELHHGNALDAAGRPVRLHPRALQEIRDARLECQDGRQ